VYAEHRRRFRSLQRCFAVVSRFAFKIQDPASINSDLGEAWQTTASCTRNLLIFASSYSFQRTCRICVCLVFGSWGLISRRSGRIETSTRLRHGFSRLWNVRTGGPFRPMIGCMPFFGAGLGKRIPIRQGRRLVSAIGQLRCRQFYPTLHRCCIRSRLFALDDAFYLPEADFVGAVVYEGADPGRSAQ